MGRGKRCVAVLATALLVAACTGKAGPGPGANPTTPVRRLAGEVMAPCTIKGDYPVQAQAKALCGTLRVPETPAAQKGRQIGLRVAVVPAVATDPKPSPLFVVAGGPGEAGTQFFAWLPGVFTDVHATRDIVLIDQRGTGASHALRLPQMPDTSGLSEAAMRARFSAWLKNGLASIDADPRSYTTTVAADDIDAVRAALGYQKIDLYGTSYGGTLVQYYLRQHPDRAGLAVLDGSTPVDVPVFERMAASSQAALDLLFRRCARDPACHHAFPRLREEWASTLHRLATPLTVVDAKTGKKAVVDKVMLAEAIHSALRTESTAALIPLAIHLVARNQWVEAARLIGTSPSTGPVLLMDEEIRCAEAWARFDPAAVARQGAGSYALPLELAQAEQRAAMCRYLPKGAVPPDDAVPVRSGTPVLWLVGDGDPQDPPANLTRIPVQEPNSRIVVMPAQQHVVGQIGCMPRVIAAFLDAGSVGRLDTSCVAEHAPPPFRLE